jgi:hypothetical protein
VESKLRLFDQPNPLLAQVMSLALKAYRLTFISSKHHLLRNIFLEKNILRRTTSSINALIQHNEGNY